MTHQARPARLWAPTCLVAMLLLIVLQVREFVGSFETGEDDQAVELRPRAGVARMRLGASTALATDSQFAPLAKQTQDQAGQNTSGQSIGPAPGDGAHAPARVEGGPQLTIGKPSDTNWTPYQFKGVGWRTQDDEPQNQVAGGWRPGGWVPPSDSDGDGNGEGGARGQQQERAELEAESAGKWLASGRLWMQICAPCGRSNRAEMAPVQLFNGRASG